MSELTSGQLPPRLTEEQMKALAHSTIETFVNSCHCKSKDDVLLALAILLGMGIDAGDTVKHGKMVTLQ